MISEPEMIGVDPLHVPEVAAAYSGLHVGLDVLPWHRLGPGDAAQGLWLFEGKLEQVRQHQGSATSAT